MPATADEEGGLGVPIVTARIAAVANRKARLAEHGPAPAEEEIPLHHHREPKVVHALLVRVANARVAVVMVVAVVHPIDTETDANGIVDGLHEAVVDDDHRAAEAQADAGATG